MFCGRDYGSETSTRCSAIPGTASTACWLPGSGYSIETPRLLLSTTDRDPHRLGNDHDDVGRYLMVQGAPHTAGRFEDDIRTPRRWRG